MWNGRYEEIKAPRSFLVYDNNNNNSIAETNDDVAAAETPPKNVRCAELKQNEAGEKNEEFPLSSIVCIGRAAMRFEFVFFSVVIKTSQERGIFITNEINQNS